MLLALLREDELSQVVRDSVPALAQLPLDELLSQVCDASPRAAPKTSAVRPTAHAGGAGEAAASGKGPGGTKLEQFTVDLTERARKGDIDPVLERFTEVQQVIDILTRRRQNNPIIVGEAGVGKTAIVEGLALRVVKGDVPPPLKDVTLRILDLGLLQAGAGMRGEFESRLKAVIDEVKASLKPIISVYR
jgi:type VI secretion system protein VasG